MKYNFLNKCYCLFKKYIISIMSTNWLNLLRKQNQSSNKNFKKSPKNVKNVKKNSKNLVRTPLTKLAQQQKINAESEKLQNQRKDENVKNKKKSSLSNRQQEIGKYLAMDCEFVGVGPGGIQSELARVSVVNYHGHLVYDKYVQPREKVTDWRTFVSGIRPSDMVNAISFNQAQSEVSELIKDKILVGHAIHHDLEALYLTHPKKLIRDTAKHTPFKKKYSKGKTPGLKLAQEILGWNIQTGEHSSVEDARATMLIYKSDKKNFESRIR